MTSNPLTTLRAGLGRRIARFVDFRVDERTRGRLEHHDVRLREAEARVTEQEHCTVDHRRRLDELEAGLERVRGDLLWTTGEVQRLVPHVAAQEARLEDLRESIALVPAGDGGQVAQARTLIEEIQRQHAQLRARLSGVARYEHRLRQLEERAGETANG
ncbi:hypothetical protein [Saccharomonospora piscinae]|uniref:hypothetical protein n=1 Tax=Saccharomonospora piscinae TaxID=687388 RepID=UPI00046425B7|nr:hypothetical protein [Saccharomonospora piscinae]